MPQAITALRVTFANPFLDVCPENDQLTMCFSIKRKYLLLSVTGGQIYPLMTATKSPKSAIFKEHELSGQVKRRQLSSQSCEGRE